MSNVVPIKKEMVKTIESVDSLLKYERVFVFEDELCYMRMENPEGGAGWYAATETGFDFIDPTDQLHRTLNTAYRAYKEEQCPSE